jgi:uncharacterized membrane protein
VRFAQVIALATEALKAEGFGVLTDIDVPDRRDDRPRETPHEVLRRRLASGEIAPMEYEERKALLDRDTRADG